MKVFSAGGTIGSQNKEMLINSKKFMSGFIQCCVDNTFGDQP